MSNEDAALIAVAADMHVVSTVGLAPPSYQLDDGGRYFSSKAIASRWRNWCTFWTEAKAKADKESLPLWAVINGDAVDNDAHGGTQVITRNEADIIGLGVDVLQPAIEVADRIFIVRGTEAHVGKSASLEEKLAEDIGAERDKKNDTWSWWVLRLVVGGVHVLIKHHASTYGRLAHTKGSAAARESNVMHRRHQDIGWPIPDIMVVAHGHYFADSGTTYKPRVLYCPGWQISTAFVHRIGGGGTIEPWGGLWFVCRDGRVEFDEPRMFRPTRGAMNVWKP